MINITRLKAVLRELNIRPSKYLGQNFIIDRNIKDKIIRSIGLNKEDIVLEIGPGLGQLTEDLSRYAKKVIAIEKDKRLYSYLQGNLKCSNLELIQGDVLNYRFDKFFGSRIKVVGNLPYYISSPILEHLINNRSFIGKIFITVQKEFASRLTAQPGKKDYSSITCFTQYYSEPKSLFQIKKTAFYLQPDVDSTFLMLELYEKGLYLTDEGKLFKIIRICFGKRRKTILNSLYSSRLFGSKEEITEKLRLSGIDEAQRPERVSLKGFVRLTGHLEKKGSA